VASLFALIFALPVLYAEVCQPDGNPDKSILDGWIYPSTLLISQHSFFGKLCHMLLYWIQFLPLQIGIVIPLGFLGLMAWRPENLEHRIFQGLSLGACIGYLLIRGS